MIEKHKQKGTPGSFILKVYAAFTIAVGLYMSVQGFRLISLDGSWYYMLAGIVLVIAGYCYWRGKLWGALLYGLFFIATLIWAIWEAGFDIWPLVPRLVAPMVLTAIALMMVPLLATGKAYVKPAMVGALFLAIGVVFFFYQMFQPQGIIRNDTQAQGSVMPETIAAGSEWRNYGRTSNSTRYAPFDQINTQNVNKLDAETGEFCKSFGINGSVDLTRNMGEVRPGFYFPTSAPTLMGDRIIIGGWV